MKTKLLALLILPVLAAPAFAATANDTAAKPVMLDRNAVVSVADTAANNEQGPGVPKSLVPTSESDA